MLNYDEMEGHEQFSASLWFQSMPRHGDDVEYCDTISNGCLHACVHVLGLPLPRTVLETAHIKPTINAEHCNFYELKDMK